MRAIIYIAAVLAATPSIAETAKEYTLTAPLVEEIFQQLAKEPYAVVAPLILKLQTEVTHQPHPVDALPPKDAK